MEQAMGAAVVGTGFGCLTHVRALRAAGFSVEALVGRDRARTMAKAARFGIPIGTTSLADALSRPGVDVVSVATPPNSHWPIVLDAIAAAKHVVCEKPFARDAAEASDMLNAAEGAGVVHLLGTEFRFATGQALATRLVREGAIGAPRTATFLLLMPLLADPAGDVPDWWSRAEEGGGWVGAHASHVIDQVRATFGEFAGVSAGLSVTSARSMTAEDTYTVHFRTRSDVDGIMQSSAGSWGPPVITTRLSGTAGTVWTEGEAVWLADKKGVRSIDPPEDLVVAPPDPPPSDLLVTAYDLMHSTGIDMGPYTRLYQVLKAAVGGEPLPTDPAPATFADGVAAMQVMDAIRLSSENRCWVDLA